MAFTATRTAGFSSQVAQGSSALTCANGCSSRATIRELAEKVVSLTGSRSKLIFKPLPEDDPRQRQPNLARAARR